MRSQALYLIFKDTIPAEENILTSLNAKSVQSKGISGDLIEAGTVIAVAASTINLLRDLLVSYVARNKSCSVKFKGLEITASSTEDIQRLLDVIKEELKETKVDDA